MVDELEVPSARRSGARETTVGVVSAYPSVRAGLRVMLQAAPHVAVLAETGDVEALGPEGAHAAIDVLVVDLPSTETIETLVQDSDDPRAPGLVLLGPAADDARLLARFGHRPWAALPRDVDGDELAAAVDAVRAGLTVLHPTLATELLLRSSAPRRLDTGDGPDELTARELEVLALLAEGIPNKTIARRLGISDHTVKFHVGSVLSKLDAASRTEAVSIGARRGLIAL